MGMVVAAHHLQLDEQIAIKFLLPEALANRDLVGRFEREARAAVKVKSEHIVRISDVGVLESGAPYMVMEYLHGSDLRALLREKGPLSLADAADYLLQACEAIAEAHALGIVHRDLKPANLFLTQRTDGSPCIKVLDFGVSKVLTSNATGEQGVTTTHTVLGSPRYMSPEQLVSTRDVDQRTDVWALGVILFELVTGTAPFAGSTVSDLAGNIMTAEPASMRSLRRDLPPGTEKLVQACLEKRREQRLQSVAEFAKRLIEFAPKHSRVSLERILRLSKVASAPVEVPKQEQRRDLAFADTETVGDFSRTNSRVTPRKWWIAGAAALVALGAVFLSIGQIWSRARASSITEESASGAAMSAAAPVPMPSAVVAPASSPLPAPAPSAAPPASAPIASTSAAPSSTSRPPRPASPVVSRNVARKRDDRPAVIASSPPASPPPPAPTASRSALGGRM